MTGEDLLQQIQAHGMASPAIVNRLRRDSIVTGQSVETLIAAGNMIPDEALAQLKSDLLQVPYKKIDPAAVDAKLFEIIPEETARTYGSVPIELRDDLLIVGMLHPDDPKAQEALKFLARKNRLNLGVYLVSYGDWTAVVRRYSPYRSEVETAVKSLNLKEGTSVQKVVSLESASGSEDAPIIKIVADTFREAVASKASDIHIEPQQAGVRIRLRIAGDLQQVASLPAELAQPITSRIKVISSLKIDENRVPQDGRFRTRVLDRDIDFRVATFPTPLGEKVAIRVLDPQTGLKSFEDLDILDSVRAKIEAGLQKPFGMILLTGPTGAGKTTTLYAFLQTMNQEDVNIVSLEDPVEYFVSGINQSQVRPEIGYDFASGLRQILRQDPDIIMVGEIRDNETAGLAVQAALTGHVVLSTLHTNNSAGVIPRLIDMKVEPFLLPVSLNLMMAQRLLGILCPDCKTAETASLEIQKLIKNALVGIPMDIVSKYPEPYQIYHAKGCATCKGKGVMDRTGIYEVLEMTPELQNLINSTGVPSTQKIITESKRQGMISLRQDGVLKALRGIVSMEEVIRETEEI